MRKFQLLNGCVASIFLVLLLMTMGSSPVIAADVCDKKPDLPKCNPVDPPPDPDPDPEDPGALCVDSGSFFPAFAFTFSGDFTGEIFLSNSVGDCTISVYTRDNTQGEGGPYEISYRFFSGLEDGSGHGKIVLQHWDTNDSSKINIELLEFQVEAGAITTTLPLTPRIVLPEPDFIGAIHGPQLSPDGNKVMVRASEADGDRGYIWEFDIPESGAATTEDIRELARLDINEATFLEYASFHKVLYGLNDQLERVYFSYSNHPQILAYIEKGTDGLWSEPVAVAERDGLFGPSSVGLWDFGSGLKEVLTYSTFPIGPIEILDVDACVEGGGYCVVLDNIESTEFTSFTTFTEGQLPALLYVNAAGENRHKVFTIRECDLSAALESTDACYRTVIDGFKDPKRRIWDVDSAD